MKRHGAIRVAIAAVAVAVAGAQAAPRYVWSGGSETSPFETWEKAAHTISNALNGAGSSDMIVVTSGTYQIEAQLDVGNSITVQGVGDGEVIVDGQNATRCFKLTGSAVLTNLTIINGFTPASGWVSDAGGAGVRLEGGSVLHCIIRNCQGPIGPGASFHGAGVMRGCTVFGCTNNHGSGWGGAVYMGGGLIDGCLFYNNQGPKGGAVALNGVARVLNSRICFNEGGSGGGVYGDYGVVSNCTVVSNTASGEGGGLCAVGVAQVLNCTVAGNRASGQGGGLSSIWGEVQVLNCTVVSNFTATWGGGASLAENATLKNCLIAGNQAAGAAGGGGVFFNGGGRAINCTVVRNLASAAGGGFRNWTTPNGAATNCIAYYNQDDGSGQDVYANGMTIGYVCAGNVADGQDGCTTNPPQFLSAGSGSGTNSILGDYHLRRASPCRDTGTNDVAWMTNALDLDGNPRIYPPLPAGRVDMGCYEVGPPMGTMIMFR